MENAISSTEEAYNIINTLIRSFDVSVVRYVIELRKPFLSSFFFVTTHFADALVVLIVMLIVAIALKAAKYHKDIIPFVTCVVGSALSSEFLKLLFSRERPSNALYFEPTYSFPSTHAALSVALYGFIAYIIMKRVPQKSLAVILTLISLIIAGIVALSRIYLGVHYTSDVAGGIFIALFWIIVSIRLGKSLGKDTPHTFSAR